MTPKDNPPAGESGAGKAPAQRRKPHRLAAKSIQPVAVPRPEIDPQLTRLGAIERAGEVLRYSLRRAEYWISPRGTLREWLRLNLRLALLIGIPTIVLTPIVTLLLSSAVTWSGIVVQICRNLALVPAWIGTGLMIVAGICFLLRLLSGR